MGKRVKIYHALGSITGEVDEAPSLRVGLAKKSL